MCNKFLYIAWSQEWTIHHKKNYRCKSSPKHLKSKSMELLFVWYWIHQNDKLEMKQPMKSQTYSQHIWQINLNWNLQSSLCQLNSRKQDQEKAGDVIISESAPLNNWVSFLLPNRYILKEIQTTIPGQFLKFFSLTERPCTKKNKATYQESDWQINLDH